MLESLNEQDLCDQLCSVVKIKKRSETMCMLQTPFKFPDGDGYSIYLTETGTGGIRVTDGGSTLMHLSYENDLDKYFKGNRHILMQEIIKENNIKFNEESGQFYKDTMIDGIGKSVFHLGQAITSINNLEFLKQSRASSTFYEDLTEKLESIIKDQEIHKDYLIPNLVDAASYPVDYMINGKASPIFLFGISDNSKALRTTVFLQHYIQCNVEFDSILVFRDQTKISARDLALLTNVGGETVSSLNAAADLARKINRKVA